MSPLTCPGQDPMFLKAADIAEVPCPSCGQAIEFWPSDVTRRCPACGTRFGNPGGSMKCLAWCRYAAECLSALQGANDGLIQPLRDELSSRMERALAGDAAAVEHTLHVLRLAEQIALDTGADALVLVPAAILHDVGRAPSARGAEGEGHGRAGRREAAELLDSVGLPAPVVAEILDLVEHHHVRERMDTRNGRPLFDADLIVNLREARRADWRTALEQGALTEAGRTLGTRVLSDGSEG